MLPEWYSPTTLRPVPSPGGTTSRRSPLAATPATPLGMPGVPMAEVCRAINTVLEAKGYAEFCHPPHIRRRGHGLGFASMRPGDVALVRLDVLPTLDGIEPGLDQVRELAHRGVHVLNRPEALLAMHDKLRTARTLAAAGIPHPTTVHVPAAGPVPAVPVPGVLKPRFGSWGRDVVRYESREAFEDAVAWAAR